MRAATEVLVAPAMPQVNLLPGDVRQARTLGFVRRWLLVSAGVTALAVGTVAGVAELQGQTARSELAQAEAETASMAAEQRPLVDVTTVRSELETLTSARSYGLAPEILWADYLGAITAVTPAGVGIMTLTYSGATPLSGAAVSADPLIRTGVGTLTLTALAAELPDTAAWADALDALPGLRDVRVVTSTRNTLGPSFSYEFTVSVVVDDGALAHRFDATTEEPS